MKGNGQFYIVWTQAEEATSRPTFRLVRDVTGRLWFCV